MQIGDQVTPGAVLVMSAKDMHEDRAGWLQLRRKRPGVGYCIGSSDTAGVLGIAFGVERAATPVRLWYEKVKHIETPDNPQMTWGRLHEDTIATYFRVRNRCVTEDVGLISSIEKPWHQTSLDRIITECPLDRRIKGRCALEVKTRNVYGMRRWHTELPDDVLAQICHQIYVSGFDHIHWACLVGGNDYRQGVVRREDEAATIAYVIDKADEFRDLYLQDGNEIEPPWDEQIAAAAYLELDALKYPERLGVQDIDDVGEVFRAAELRAKKNLYTRLEKEQKAVLLRQAHGARHLTYAGELAYEFKPRTRTTINTERLAEKYPDAFNDPEIVSTTVSWQLNLADPFKVKTVEEDQ